METVEVMIKLPKQVYEHINVWKDIVYDDYIAMVTNAILNGTVLPKGHGRIGDLDALRKEVSSWGMNDYDPSDFTDAIDQADTIIEADKENT